MSEAAFSVCTPLRLLAPAEFAFGGARGEIQMTQPSELRLVVLRFRTLSRVICKINVNLLDIATIPDCYVYRTTWVQCIVVDSVHPLICMNLQSGTYISHN